MSFAGLRFIDNAIFLLANLLRCDMVSVPPLRSTSIARKLKRYLTSCEVVRSFALLSIDRRNEMRQACRKFAEHEFSPRVFAESFLDIVR